MSRAKEPTDDGPLNDEEKQLLELMRPHQLIRDAADKDQAETKLTDDEAGAVLDVWTKKPSRAIPGGKAFNLKDGLPEVEIPKSLYLRALKHEGDAPNSTRTPTGSKKRKDTHDYKLFRNIAMFICGEEKCPHYLRKMTIKAYNSKSKVQMSEPTPKAKKIISDVKRAYRQPTSKNAPNQT